MHHVLMTPPPHAQQVHRIGRCGRAGSFGVAHTFVIDGDEKLVAPLIEILERAKQTVPFELHQLAEKIARAEAAANMLEVNEDQQLLLEQRQANREKQQQYQQQKKGKGGDARKGGRKR